MGSTAVFEISALILAMLGGTFVGKACARVLLKHGKSSYSDIGNIQIRCICRLQNGFVPFKPISQLLLRSKKINGIMESNANSLTTLGFPTDKQAFLSLIIPLSIIVGVGGFILTSSIVFGLALSAIAIIWIFATIRSRFNKRNMSMREQIPEALRCMGACFRSGQSMVQTLEHTSKELDNALGSIFSIAADRLKMGEPTSQALAIMRKSANVPELSFISVALGVQHQSGGSITPVLESARESVEGELELMRTLRVQTAQAKLSASIVTVMPFILVALFSLMSPDFLAPFFSSFIGMILLAIALTMQIAGVCMVRRMLKIDAD